MKKLGKYLRYQKASIIVCVCFLLLQACFGLTIPKLASNLIDIGVQQKGIESCVPEKFSKKGMELIAFVLPESEEVEFLSCYRLSDNKLYELIPQKNTSELHELFYNAAATGINLAMDKAGNRLSGLSANSINIAAEMGDVELVYDILTHMSSYDENELKKVYTEASEIPTAIKKQYAAVMNPYFYEDAGYDCEQLQKNYVIKVGVLLILFTASQIIFIIFTLKIATKISTRVTTALRKDFLLRTANLSLKQRNNLKHDLFASFSHDTNNTGLIIKYSFNQFILAPVLSIGSIICCFSISPTLSLIVLATVFITILVLFFIVRKAIPVYEKMQGTYSKLSGIFKTNITQLYTIRTLQTQQLEKEKILNHSEALKKQERYILRSVFLGLTIVTLISNIVITLSVLPLGKNLLSSSLGIGDFIAFLQYSSITVSAFTTIAAVILFAPRAKVSINNISEIFEVCESSESTLATENLSKESPHEIEFRNVTLESTDNKQLNNVSFVAEKGKITAITGPTGCGKTCLLQTLIGNEKKDSGSILIDSRELENIALNSLRERISYGFSSPKLFSATIKDNLSMYGAKDSERITEALRICAVDFIDDTNIFLENAGARFSGGQKARIALAGVMAKDAGIYILDDCLKSLDTDTEKFIFENLQKKKNSATIIIVSQKANTLAAADKIIVIDDGTISAQGTHHDVLKKSDYYKQLVALQQNGGAEHE